MVAQKYWDDTPLRNVDFATAWSRVQPDERPCPIERVNAMECIFLGALGFDLYVPEQKYDACVAELIAVVEMHRHDEARRAALPLAPRQRRPRPRDQARKSAKRRPQQTG